MSRADCVKEFSEIPKKYLELLYLLRFYEDRDVPFDEYVNNYGTIEADGIFYYRENEKYKIADWLRSNLMRVLISDAVIVGNTVIKNRKGCFTTKAIWNSKK